MPERRKTFTVGIMGGSHCSEDTARLARRLGAEIAGKGWHTLTGGRAEGVMDAASLGAREAGGTVIGLLPGESYAGMSRGVTVPVLTGVGHGRNWLNVLNSDAVIALPGSHGTLSEIHLGRCEDRPVLLLGWKLPGPSHDLPACDTVEEAMQWLEHMEGLAP